MVQEAFAEELEVAQGVVSAWEREEYFPTAENYVNLAVLAAKQGLHLEALQFLERAGVGADLVASVSYIARESRSKRDAAYRQGLIEAQAIFPNDKIAQHRFAMRAAERALHLKGKKSR